MLSQTTGTGTSASTLAYCYDANGNQTSSIAADGNATALAPCNTNSSFPGIVDPTAYPTQANYQTTYKYDSVGELVSSTSPVTAAAPAGATTTYRYDAAQDQVSTTDPNGVTASSTYNSAGEMTGVTYSGSAAHSVSYTYDPEGSITSMVDATGTSTYSFDPFGELTSATNGAGKTVGYGYNSDGATTAITYPLPASATWATSPTVSYGYDAAGLLTSVTDFNGKKITIASNNNGEPATETLAATGDTITTDYDQTGSPSAINLKNGTTTLLGFSYAEAPSGSVLTETDTPSSSQPTTTYTYDSLGRVTSTTQGTAPTAHYLFDNSGNLTTTPTGAAGSYDFAGELTSATAAGTTTNYTYDADGQQLSAKQGTTTLSSGTWDGAGDLTSFSDPQAAMTAATYDGDGLRTSATTSGTAQSFTWAAGSSAMLMDSTNAYIYGIGTAPAEQVNLATGQASYLTADSLGSVRGVVAANGTLTASTSYDAWGNPQTAGGLSSYTPYGYAGGYTDATGLIYLVNRYYNPATGQFLSVDPEVDQSGQPYAYADDNPVELPTRPARSGRLEYGRPSHFTARRNSSHGWAPCWDRVRWTPAGSTKSPGWMLLVISLTTATGGSTSIPTIFSMR